MATKTEERLKNLFDERLDNTMQKISENVYSIFLWGVVTGIVLSYTNMLSLTAGVALGYVVAKKEIPLVEIAIMKTFFLFKSSGLLRIVKEKLS